MGDALTRLADAVEVGKVTSADFVADALPQLIKSMPLAIYGAYNGSLDAAKALHDAVLPNKSIILYYGPFAMPSAKVGVDPSVHNSIPARAWLLAILRALAQVQK